MPRDDYDRLKATLCNCVRLGPHEQNRDGVADFRGASGRPRRSCQTAQPWAGSEAVGTVRADRLVIREVIETFPSDSDSTAGRLHRASAGRRGAPMESAGSGVPRDRRLKLGGIVDGSSRLFRGPGGSTVSLTFWAPSSIFCPPSRPVPRSRTRRAGRLRTTTGRQEEQNGASFPYSSGALLEDAIRDRRPQGTRCRSAIRFPQSTASLTNGLAGTLSCWRTKKSIGC